MDTTHTLARKLGTTEHLSPVLHKAHQLGLDAKGLEGLAVQRGCHYYHSGALISGASVPELAFSNEELAIALLNPSLRYHPQTIRFGAAMLGAEGNDPARIAYLAKLERSEQVVRYIADAGKKFEPKNQFWTTLLELLPQTAPPKSSVVPHPTRFVAMTGFTRRGVETIVQWIRPEQRKTVHG